MNLPCPYKDFLEAERANNKTEIKTETKIVEKYYTPEEIIGSVLEEKFSLVNNLKIEDYSVEYKNIGGIYRIKVTVSYSGIIESKLVNLITSLL